MNVPLSIQLGLNGSVKRLRPIFLDAGAIGATSSWAGSYHVLVMGRHYDDYVVTLRALRFPPIVGLPPAHPYERLTGKIRAAGVTGNIGEAIAAIFATRYLGARIADVTHIRPRRPFRRRKAPDYLMRLGRLMPGVFQDIVPSIGPIPWPMWWPVESKARSTEAGANAGQRDALRQLVAYWSLLARSRPQVVGFGMIVTFAYQPPRQIRVALVIPRNQVRIVQVIEQAGQEVNEPELKTCLYAC